AGNAAAAPPHASLSVEQLASKVGLYRDASTGNVGRIFVRDGQLMASADTGEDNSVGLTPLSANRFVVLGTPIAIEFVPAGNGRAPEIHVTGDGPKPVVSQKLEPFALSSKQLRAYAGEYGSPELEVTYTLAARGSGLVVQMPGRGDTVLRPIAQDVFAGGVLNVVKFSRDAHGVIMGFTVNTNGV